MRLCVAGRVQKIHLSPANCLMPMFEAIANSIQAIHAVPEMRDGRIDVKVQRDSELIENLVSDRPELQPITGFLITDNGEGFHDVNYDAFDTSDTLIKQNIGGKGVGRLMWLKAFERAEIQSVYKEDGRYFRRAFSFSIDADGVADNLRGPADIHDAGTTVHLMGYKSPYKEACPKNLSALADRVAEHFLEYLILGSCPDVHIHDEDGISLCVTDRAKSSLILNRTDGDFSTKGIDFKITSLRLDSAQHSQHKVHYCGGSRVVVSDPLTKYIPDLAGKVKDEDGQAFTYTAYVSGPYLDGRISDDRTGFTIPEKGVQETTEEVYWDDITDGATTVARSYLREYILPITEAKKERVERYVEEKAPRYLYVLKSNPQVLDSIPPDASEAKMEEELNKALYNLKSGIAKQAKEILGEDLATVENLPEYKERFSAFLQQVNEIGKSELAEYVVHRRLVLDLVDNALRLGESGDYSYEDAIHGIVFPMRKSSDDLTDWGSQNLWIIDEKLSFHRYLASDKQFRQMGILESDSLRRPDLIVFNRAFAFTPDDDPLYSVVIIEFKRPAKEAYDEKDNPVAQVYAYIDEIRAGKRKDEQGRPIRVVPNTRFYCYIIADIPRKLETQLTQYGLRPTPDGNGYYFFNETYGYIEVISFTKLVSDARKRNRILFEKLNLPI